MAVSLPKTLFKKIQPDTISSYLKICLLNDKDLTAILGVLQLKDKYIFEPLLPFSRGSHYIIYYKNKQTAEFDVPAADIKNFPEVITCFPQQDTLPENVLKLYLAFSHPMSEEQSAKYITLLKRNGDTLKGEFLNLQPELWNEDRTVLTVWFDPGRIKRYLQPNLKLGAPLKRLQHYRLVISHEWKDVQGVPLRKDFNKSFVAGNRDSLSPDTDHWKLMLPIKNLKNALIIHTDEPLDHYLFEESLQIKDENGVTIKGNFEIFNRDKSCRFIPRSKWKPGNYSIRIESRLEDLAGNNLNRPFDRDIVTTREALQVPWHEIKFKIAFSL